MISYDSFQNNFTSRFLNMNIYDNDSFDNEMWSWEEHDHGGHDSVDAETNQTEPVNHHRCKLPVWYHQVLLILLPHSLGQVPESWSWVSMSVYHGWIVEIGSLNIFEFLSNINTPQMDVEFEITSSILPPPAIPEWVILFPWSMCDHLISLSISFTSWARFMLALNALLALGQQWCALWPLWPGWAG